MVVVVEKILNLLGAAAARRKAADQDVWGACADGECQCSMIMTDGGLVAEVARGPWGDRYADLRLVGGPLDRKVEAFIDTIEYGSVDPALAAANARHIVDVHNHDYAGALRVAIGAMMGHAQSVVRPELCGRCHEYWPCRPANAVREIAKLLGVE